ncbi:MAG: NADH-quinone oxidoreductase subunit [Oscillospiraceae bacterium]|nr:NADH-quinone oxidoreductase subunit [Oscillospiraceae bacterium]
MGSSCHLKGSYQVIKTFQDLIKNLNLEEKILLKASFCQGKCTDGIAVTFDGEQLTHLSINNAEQIFNEVIVPRL